MMTPTSSISVPHHRSAHVCSSRRPSPIARCPSSNCAQAASSKTTSSSSLLRNSTNHTKSLLSHYYDCLPLISLLLLLLLTSIHASLSVIPSSSSPIISSPTTSPPTTPITPITNTLLSTNDIAVNDVIDIGNGQGFLKRVNFGSDNIKTGNRMRIQFNNASRVVEMYTERSDPSVQGIFLVNVQAEIVLDESDASKNVIVRPVLVDEQVLIDRGMVLYRYNLSNEFLEEQYGSAGGDDDDDDMSVMRDWSLYRRIIRVNTTYPQSWFEMGSAIADRQFYASEPRGVIHAMQFFLGAITYPVFFVWALLLLLASVIYWCAKEKGKKNMAAIGEVSRKRMRQLILISFGVVLILLSLAFLIVVPFFTRRESYVVCCRYFDRRFNSDETPVQSYGNNCNHVSFLNKDKRMRELRANCFSDESFTMSYEAHVWWWLILCGTIPALVLYTVGHVAITIGVYKLLRLIKKQHNAHNVTKFKVGFD